MLSFHKSFLHSPFFSLQMLCSGCRWNLNVGKFTTFYECIRTAIKHFQYSVDDKEILDTCLAILQLYNCERCILHLHVPQGWLFEGMWCSQLHNCCPIWCNVYRSHQKGGTRFTILAWKYLHTEADGWYTKMFKKWIPSEGL